MADFITEAIKKPKGIEEDLEEVSDWGTADGGWG